MKSVIYFVMMVFSLSSVFAQNYSTKLLIKDADRQFMQPVFSPDGSKIAFTEANYRGLWLMNSDASDSRKISDEFAAGYRLQWSSDSKAILSRVAKFENKRRYNAVKIFDIQNNTSSQLTEFVTLMPGIPHWSALNDQIIYPDKKQLHKIDSGKQAESIKSLQRLVCFEFKNKLVVSSAGSQEFNYFDPVPGSQYLNPVVSGNGQKIAFETVGGHMYVMNSDGSGLQDLGPGYYPHFSPENNQIVFMVTADDGHHLTASDIYIINIDGSGLRNITNTSDKIELNPDWSPVENKIVFDVMYEGAIYQLELK